MKDLIIDVEPLMDEGYSIYSIATMLRVDIELIEQCVAYIDEQRYHTDMAADPYKTYSIIA
jgi:hypothetical protein